LERLVLAIGTKELGSAIGHPARAWDRETDPA
jgi:hypothetical protein